MSDIAIGVHGLRKHFGEVEALTGADFEVQEAEDGSQRSRQDHHRAGVVHDPEP